MTGAEELNLADPNDPISREAFRTLLDDAAPLTTARIAQRASVSEAGAERALRSLRAIGRVEFDEQGRVVGIFGLTLARTGHRMELAGVPFYTWCAWDAVGIPAALGVSATVTDRCERCGRELRFDIEGGRPPDLPIVVSWLPEPCGSIKEEFCPTVNFFCDRRHLAEWAPEGYPDDGFLTLAEAAEEGVKAWGWARAQR